MSKVLNCWCTFAGVAAVLIRQAFVITVVFCGQVFENEAALRLDSNPLHWSVREVVDFLMTTDCACMTKLIVDQVSYLANYPSDNRYWH